MMNDSAAFRSVKETVRPVDQTDAALFDVIGRFRFDAGGLVS